MNKDLKGNLIKMAEQADDPTAASRKRDHIELAFRSQIQSSGSSTFIQTGMQDPQNRLRLIFQSLASRSQLPKRLSPT